MLVACFAVWPVVFRRHAHHEAGRAVAALRAAAHRHLVLDGMQRAGPPDAFGGHDLLPLQRAHQYQAGIHRVQPRAAPRLLSGDQHRAGPAFPLGAAFLAARHALGTQPVQQGGLRPDLLGHPLLTVDRQIHTLHDVVSPPLPDDLPTCLHASAHQPRPFPACEEGRMVGARAEGAHGGSLVIHAEQRSGCGSSVELAFERGPHREHPGLPSKFTTEPN